MRKNRSKRRRVADLLAPIGRALPIYGKFCGPGWGDLHNSAPIDRLDECCRQHDLNVGLGSGDADSSFSIDLAAEGSMKAFLMDVGYKVFAPGYKRKEGPHDFML